MHAKGKVNPKFATWATKGERTASEAAKLTDVCPTGQKGAGKSRFIRH